MKDNRMVLLSLLSLLVCTNCTNANLEPANSLTIPSHLSSKPAPRTGLVLWDSNAEIQRFKDSVALEFRYFAYSDIVSGSPGAWVYDWSSFDAFLDDAGERGHHGIARFKDTDPLWTSPGVPNSIRGTTRTAIYAEGIEGATPRTVYFPDWTGTTMHDFVISFYQALAEHCQNRQYPPAVIQVGFGLWAEYHIDFSGLSAISDPTITNLSQALGTIFPSKAQQLSMIQALSTWLANIPWGISIDAANTEYGAEALFTPGSTKPYGVFDDSFLCAGANADNWNICQAVAKGMRGGEISYYTSADQANALAPNGPNGVSLAVAARSRGLSYLIGDGQTNYHNEAEIATASKLLGYRFEIRSATIQGDSTLVSIRNNGTAAPGFDIYPAMGGVRSATSLRNLGAEEEISLSIPALGTGATFSLEADGLAKDQFIPYQGN